MTAAKGIQVGLAERVITPPPGAPMAGFAARKGGAQGVHDDLHARAMVIEGPDTAVAVLSASVCSLSQEVIDGTREEVSRRTGLPGAQILMAATHTHSGPTLTEAYAPYLKGRCVECLVDAWEHREEGRLGVGVGHAEDVGRNRRRLDYGGLPVDPEVGIVRVEDGAGKIRGVLFNYACHPTTMGPDNLMITEDWACYAIRTIREQAGRDAVVIYVNGAEGDINPGYSSGLSCIGAPIPIRTFAYAEKIGVRLGRAVLEGLAGVETKAALSIRSVSSRVDLPLRRTFPVTIEEAGQRRKAAQEALERLDPGASRVVRHRAEVEVFFAGMVCRQAEQFHSEERRPSVSVELQSLRLDDAALTTFPGEVFVEIGLEVKRRSPFRKTLVIGLANAGRTGGYLPTKETFDEGDYEVLASRYSPEAGDVLMEATLKQLAQIAS
ncbi:MAG: hypothetical protein A3F84_07560 [Candidatus Handelsmanbacteria bacterium RIFCSPLOWO2_12_FULL_64_10]|uniref:Neutral/alkaline non-lysosomal ceramidase N-terminal domain-containing protein n=1 Tax=Handelsmanbacteria sp. (strain RIFCSPLOWO2_12_FULL_64_10) TaxID=1817868 RepID=A0A1F6CYT0_HANXR|nr:MAG: hypothetical protein A3F84_07560 [Candidatus Handelsmanbacteria bacterium RIFCSPLOWO2_12_FULL_64_10]